MFSTDEREELFMPELRACRISFSFSRAYRQ